MPDRSAPQVGIGWRSNSFSALSRRSSIHCGSLFGGDVADDVLVDPAARGCTGGVGVRPAERVPAERVDLLVLGQRRHGCVLVMRASSPGRSWGRCWSVRAARALLAHLVQGFAGGSVPRTHRSGDVCGADPVAVGDRGQPLHVGADQPADHRGLGLAQLRELRGHVRHRAVVLAELPAAGDRRGRGSVALGGERGGECLGPVDRSHRRARSRPAPRRSRRALEPGQLLLGHGADGVGTAGGGDVAQRGQGQVVVGVRERANGRRR